ncbi:MAG: TonB-dependent receptor [Steroidobacteraceae bacterium]|nr:TonB-dependent receptor [Steroidobacteraceae bacterium]
MTGSRIEQRLADAPVAVVVLGRDDIERSSQDAIGKLLQQLPANTGSPVNTNVNNGGDGSTRVDLRGLGAARSLVLMNGRRFVYGGVGGDTAVDVNMVPMSMLERVEVMGVGSSTIYGSDAIGGVVNFITRDDFDGAEFDASHTVTDRGDGAISDLQFVIGRTFGRGYVTAGAEWVDQEAVFQDARAYSRDTEYLRADGTIGTSGSIATPQGFFVLPAGNAFGFTPGPYTRVAGSAAPATAEDFRPYLIPDDNFNFAPDNYLQTPSERYYAWLLGGFDVTDRVSLFAEAMLHQRDSEQRLAASSFRSTASGAILPNGRPGIPADNWYNPFGVNLTVVQRRFEEQGGRRFTQDVDTQRYVLGLRGDIGPAWSWELSAGYGRNETEVTTEGDFRTDRMRLALGPSGPDASGRIVCGKRDPATDLVPASNVIAGCVPLDVFGGQGPDGRGTITQEQLDYVTLPMTDEGYNEQQGYELLFRGDWGAIESRPIRWALGATYRVESAGNALDPAKLEGATGGGQVTSLTEGGDFTAGELYAETVLPLLADVPAAEMLNVTAGARYSDFSTFGSVTTWQGGVLYRPQSQVTVRAGYGQVFRAPPIANLFESNLTSSQIMEDPCGRDPTPEQQANCAAAGVPGGSYVQEEFDVRPFEVGGNRDLRPEEGDSYSAGVTLVPSAMPEFSISLDWWRTELDDVITLSPEAQLILDSCADFGAAEACRRVSRYADGTIERVDARHMNAASLAAEGYDLDVAYSRQAGAGTLDARLMTTYLARHELKSFAESATLETAGTRDFFEAYPEWRGLAHVAYAAGPWSASWQVQYIGELEECEESAFLPADAFQGCRTIDDVWYHDLQFAWQFDHGFAVTLSVLNLTDVDPPRVNFNAAANTDPATYRLLGRTYFAAVRYRLE